MALPTLWNKIGENGNGIPASLSDFTQLLFNILGILLFAAGALAVIYMIIGGITYSTSAGNDKNIAKAKSIMANAIIGVLLSSFAFLIVRFIAGRF